MIRLCSMALALLLPLNACDGASKPPLQSTDLVTFEYWYTQMTGTYCASVHLDGSGPALGRVLNLTLSPLQLSEAPYERTGGTFLVGGEVVQVTATCQRPDGTREFHRFAQLVPRDPDDQHPLVLLVRSDGMDLGLATRSPSAPKVFRP
ncbi:hypothetical protein GO986_11925 [Deinococcus sp. HMF7620]|uniref:Lipoprotein n=1 Tax=Deinococcus arboris TaxID=2682977 RepID=A0A7C9LNV8_9DEIO|nr:MULTISPECIES: hypothetical protein [Deinococcus]MBZ9752172.1 hypothetical protein [Deinococcus betulae]MVN87476.1 hypothetical protein [Deinococcus arboris]